MPQKATPDTMDALNTFHIKTPYEQRQQQQRRATAAATTTTTDKLCNQFTYKNNSINVRNANDL